MRNLVSFVCLFLIFTAAGLSAQSKLIEKLLKDNPDKFGEVLSNIDSFEVQIIYTQINRDKNNFPSFKTYKYRVNPKDYFYAASTVKLPTALMALEKLNNLKIKGMDKYTPLRIDSARVPQTKVAVDTSSESGLPNIANYIKKIFLVSDNDAYCRLYEFVGQKELNEGLHKKGYKNVKITNRYTGGFNSESNRYTNPFTFYNGAKIIYSQPEQYNSGNYSFNLNGLIKGIGYWDSKDSLINAPYDFSAKNFVSLEDLTEILKTVLFPETRKAKARFNLTKDDYRFLYKYMSMLPKESKHPGYDTTHYDSYVKYFLFGDSKKPIPGNFRIFNKVGLAYGYLTDIAYIVDFENKVEFMLSAVIHVNKDQIYNDGIYEYDKIGMPFLSNLGKVIYEYEKVRPKKYSPNLSKFKFDY
ncbi:MAG: serine hydrolase [Ignavibacteriales bacterium]|nr:serine hydrolase [Ignavibacteriales bacterium]